MNSISRLILVVLALFSLTLSGCISLVPTPSYARAGDVVNIGLGGVKRNASGQLVLTSDLTVTITDANSIVHTPQVVGTYRVFPDHTSQYAVGAQDRVGGSFFDLYPHDGALWVTLRLSDATNAPLPLATGDAFITISSAKLTQTAKENEGDYSNFPITILAGTGTPSLSDQQNQAYQTEGFLSIKPSVTPGVTVGGAQIEIIFDDTVTAGNPFELRVVTQTHDPNAGLIQSVTDNGDGTKTLKAILTNPNGYVPVASWAQGQSTLLDLDLAIVSSGGGVAATANADLPTKYTVTANSYYVDLNGDIVPGVVPVLSNDFF